MKKTIAILALLLLVSCNTYKAKTFTDFYFTPQTTFAFDSAPVDPLKSAAEMKYLLAQQGFNIVSYESAQKALEHPGEITAKKKSTELTEIYSIKDHKSVYKIELSYRYYHDIFYYAYKQFWVKVVDMNTDGTVLIIYFKGDKSVDSVLKEAARRLTQFRR